MKFTVLQWNILFEEPIAQVAGAIKAWKPDIFCLQELTNGLQASHPNTGQYLAKTLDQLGHYAYAPMVLPTGQSSLMGNGIFSRFPIIGHRLVILQTGQAQNNQVTRDGRIYLEADLDLNGKVLTVGTTHLPFHPQFYTTKTKRAMIEKLLAEAKIGGNYILAGDFNTTPRTAAVKSLKSRLRHAGPAYTQKTWTTKPFKIRDLQYNSLNWRLDYIFCSRQIRPVKSEIIQTTLSDHLPILSTFEV